MIEVELKGLNGNEVDNLFRQYDFYLAMCDAADSDPGKRITIKIEINTGHALRDQQKEMADVLVDAIRGAIITDGRARVWYSGTLSTAQEF